MHPDSNQIRARRATFRQLHAAGCFAIPNPWDAASARWLAGLGFQALASTSSGHAWSQGHADGGMPLPAVLDYLRSLVAATDLPVNADFEHGFADDAAGVARNVALAVDTGISGLSIEDSTGDPDSPLYDLELAVDRIRAAREAIDRSGTGVLLTARSEGFVCGRPDIDETVRRLQAYAAAGADCLYAPRIDTVEHSCAGAVPVARISVRALSAISRSRARPDASATARSSSAISGRQASTAANDAAADSRSIQAGGRGVPRPPCSSGQNGTASSPRAARSRSSARSVFARAS